MTDQTAPAPPAAALARAWWSKLMSGADNQTPAIGRYLGAILFLNFLLALPTIIVVVLLMQGSKWDTWQALLASLGVYIPLVSAAIVGLIRVTHATEPCERRPDGGDR